MPSGRGTARRPACAPSAAVVPGAPLCELKFASLLEGAVKTVVMEVSADAATVVSYKLRGAMGCYQRQDGLQEVPCPDELREAFGVAAAREDGRLVEEAARTWAEHALARKHRGHALVQRARTATEVVAAAASVVRFVGGAFPAAAVPFEEDAAAAVAAASGEDVEEDVSPRPVQPEEHPVAPAAAPVEGVISDEDAPCYAEEEEEASENLGGLRPEANYWLAADEPSSNESAKDLAKQVAANERHKNFGAPKAFRIPVDPGIVDHLHALFADTSVPSATRTYERCLSTEHKPSIKARADASRRFNDEHAEPEWAQALRLEIQHRFAAELDGSTINDAHVLRQDNDLFASFDVHTDIHEKTLTWSATLLLHVAKRPSNEDDDDDDDRGQRRPVGRMVVLGTEPVAYAEPGDGFLFRGHDLYHRTIPRKGFTLFKITFFWRADRKSKRRRRSSS